tara:strand:+ start:6717 stop:7661 length:945 start_codon:yes stop_codon:yes gene_type:complete
MSILNKKPAFDLLSKDLSSLAKPPKLKFGSRQITIKGKIVFRGNGLHSGKKVKMIVHPAEENSGYQFRVKSGLNSYTNIRAIYNNVVSTNLSTTIASGNFRVSTVEHILSALYALRVDNAIIELEQGNEIPIMDGSSFEFVRGIKDSGFEEQNYFKKSIKVNKVIEVKSGSKIARISPHDETIFTCEVGYDSKVIGNQSMSIIFNPSIYESQISRARTFGFLEDIDYLHKNGLALGGSLENAIVISKDRVLNKEGLRFSDEFVRHKTLDLIGDLSLSGYYIKGSIYSFHGGHNLNNLLLHKLFSSKENYEIIDF